MKALIPVLIIIIAGLAIWVLARGKITTAPPAIPSALPSGISPDEEKAKKAAEIAAKALYDARTAVYEKQIAEQAAKVRDFEQQLASLQAAAILKPGDLDVRAETEATETEAAVERKKLEATWQADLEFKVGKMHEAEQATIVAYSAYAAAMAKVSKWLNEADKANIGIQATNRYLQTTTDKVLWDKFLIQFNQYVANYRLYQGEAQKAKLAAVATHSQAVLAISKADDLVGDVLSRVRDLQNLGILLSLAGRVDSIAKATRTKLAEIEQKLADNPSTIIVPTYSIPPIPPAPTPVTAPALMPPTTVVLAPSIYEAYKPGVEAY